MEMQNMGILTGIRSNEAVCNKQIFNNLKGIG